MQSKIRVAVIGVGHLGRFHAQKYAALSQCALVAVVDRDAKRVQTVSQEVGAPGVERFEEILDRVDAVSIAVPTPAHYEVAKACLQAGKHVLVEKPLAGTSVEGQELVTLASRKQVVRSRPGSRSRPAPSR